MASVNKVILVGNLGADPESRTFQNGGKVVNLRIATSESWRDKATGEKREKTEWHTVCIFADHAASFAEQYLRKGSKVYVEGALQTRKWQDQSGNDRYSTEVVVKQFGGTLVNLTPKQDGGHSSQPSDRDHGGYSSPTPSPPPAHNFDDLDDDVPF